jgi:hypothetical protein
MAAFCPPYDALVYWAIARTDTIGRANLDGTAADSTFIHLAGGFPNGVAVDGPRLLDRPRQEARGGLRRRPEAEATAVRDALGSGTGQRGSPATVNGRRLPAKSALTTR